MDRFLKSPHVDLRPDSCAHDVAFADSHPISLSSYIVHVHINIHINQRNQKGGTKGESEFCALRRAYDTPLVRPRRGETRKGIGLAFGFGGTETHNRSSDPLQRKRGTTIRWLLLRDL